MNNLTIKNDVLSMYNHYLVNEKFHFNDLRASYVILVGMDNSTFSGIKNASYMDRSIQFFLEMNFATLWYDQWKQL